MESSLGLVASSFHFFTLVLSCIAPIFTFFCDKIYVGYSLPFSGVRFSLIKCVHVVPPSALPVCTAAHHYTPTLPPWMVNPRSFLHPAPGAHPLLPGTPCKRSHTDLPFRVWLISLSITLSSFMHLITGVTFFSLERWRIFICVNTRHFVYLFIHPWTFGSFPGFYK